MNLTAYDFVLNVTSSSQVNDSDEATFKVFGHNPGRKDSNGTENSLPLSPQCKQLVTDFSPPLLNCEKLVKGIETCQEEVLHHQATLVGILVYLLLYSSY